MYTTDYNQSQTPINDMPNVPYVLPGSIKNNTYSYIFIGVGSVLIILMLILIFKKPKSNVN